jgi:hypothetical protein
MNHEHIIFIIGFFAGGGVFVWGHTALENLRAKRMSRMAKKVNRYYGTFY